MTFTVKHSAIALAVLAAFGSAHATNLVANSLTANVDYSATSFGGTLLAQAITNISNAQHGTVAWATQPDGSQYIAFTPEANYFGVASYQYTVSDGNGGTATHHSAFEHAPDPMAVLEANGALRGANAAFRAEQRSLAEGQAPIASVPVTCRRRRQYLLTVRLC